VSLSSLSRASPAYLPRVSLVYFPMERRRGRCARDALDMIRVQGQRGQCYQEHEKTDEAIVHFVDDIFWNLCFEAESQVEKVLISFI
jgi:hypothetical protein